MGLFDKKGDEKKEKDISSNEKPALDEPPTLPELPELPELPDRNDSEEDLAPVKKEKLPQLPSFPSSSFGDKFSQNTIKDAVSGRKEVSGAFDDDESLEDEMSPEFPTIKGSSRQSLTEEIPGVPREFKQAAKRVQEAEPVFIRIDKFQESLKIIEKTKEKITGIEKVLHDIKTVRDQEEKELQGWEKEIQQAKLHIEKIDEEIFSKVE